PPQRLNPTAGRLDLRLRCSGERVCLHGERLVDLSPAEHFDRAALVGEPVGVERFGRHVCVEVRGEHLDVDGRVLVPIGVGEPFQLRDAPLIRHLAALEVGRDGLPRPRPLRAAPRRLATSPCPTATHAGAVGRRALCRAEMMQLHPSPSLFERRFAPPPSSSTLTRCRTFAIMPRMSARSSLTTLSCMCRRPSLRTVSFWSSGRPMTLRTCVTLT